MSNSATNPTDTEMATASEEVAPQATSVDKGKGKAVEPDPAAMEDDDEEEEEEEEFHEDDDEGDEMDEDELADLQEAIDPAERVNPGSRRAAAKNIDYSSEEALKAAGLQPGEEVEEDEEEFHDTSMNA